MESAQSARQNSGEKCVKTLHPDDLVIGLAVTVRRVLPRIPKQFELPDGRMIMLSTGNSTASPGMVGEPFRVVGIDLPFVRLQHFEQDDGSTHIVSVGDVELATFKREMFDDFRSRAASAQTISATAALAAEEFDEQERLTLEKLKQEIRDSRIFGKDTE